ncbi:MAG: hypothetical protein WCI39_09955 [Gallionellaceae bacterium]
MIARILTVGSVFASLLYLLYFANSATSVIAFTMIGFPFVGSLFIYMITGSLGFTLTRRHPYSERGLGPK